MERAFGETKEKWRILHTVLPYMMVYNKNIIKTCMMLHNYLGCNGYPMLLPENQAVPESEGEEERTDGARVRDLVAENAEGLRVRRVLMHYWELRRRR